MSVDTDDREQIALRFALRPQAATAIGDHRRALIQQLTEQLKEKTNVTFQITEVPRSELPVFEFKAVRWTDTRQSDLKKKVW